MAIHAVYCTRGDYGIYIMQHYYHRLATYCMYVDTYSYQLLFFLLSRLTVVSREAKKKQHACASSGPRDHYSELFTRMAALKF